MRRRALVAACGLFAWSADSASAAEWRAEVASGTAASLPAQLTIRQAGFAPLRIAARYDTRPFEGAPYYAWRLARWSGPRGWELQLVHHKVHLRNPPAEVEGFQVSHGYNVLTLARAWELRGWVLRAGAGIVVAHPESSVRGRPLAGDGGLFGKGYYVTGPSAQVAAARDWAFGGGFVLAPELQLTGAFARVPIDGGDASVPNLALHLRLGLGYRF